MNGCVDLVVVMVGSTVFFRRCDTLDFEKASAWNSGLGLPGGVLSGLLCRFCPLQVLEQD